MPFSPCTAAVTFQAGKTKSLALQLLCSGDRLHLIHGQLSGRLSRFLVPVMHRLEVKIGHSLTRQTIPQFVIRTNLFFQRCCVMCDVAKKLQHTATVFCWRNFECTFCACKCVSRKNLHQINVCRVWYEHKIRFQFFLVSCKNLNQIYRM